MTPEPDDLAEGCGAPDSEAHDPCGGDGQFNARKLTVQRECDWKTKRKKRDRVDDRVAINDLRPIDSEGVEREACEHEDDADPKEQRQIAEKEDGQAHRGQSRSETEGDYSRPNDGDQEKKSASDPEPIEWRGDVRAPEIFERADADQGSAENPHR